MPDAHSPPNGCGSKILGIPTKKWLVKGNIDPTATCGPRWGFLFDPARRTRPSDGGVAEGVGWHDGSAGPQGQASDTWGVIFLSRQ